MPAFRIVTMLLLTALAGCASGANSSNMTASLQPSLAAAPGSSLYQSVGLGAVTGGKETSPILASQVADGDFKTALKNSLLQSNLHAVGAEKYLVTAEIAELEQPLMGLDLTVTSKVRYKVTRVADKTVVYDKLVTQAHTATFGDSALGVERLRLANEGSIKKNISSFITEVANLRI